MKIRLITNFSFPDAGHEACHLPDSVVTVKDLLTHVGRQIGFVFIDVTGKKLRKDVEVVLNGKDMWFSPAGLETPLRDGDRVEISQMTLGGG